MEKSLSLSISCTNLSSSPSGWNFHVSSSVLLPWSARRCPPPGVCGSPCRCRTRWAWRAEARSSQGCVAFHPHREACWACWGPAAHSQISLYRTALRCDVPSLRIRMIGGNLDLHVTLKTTSVLSLIKTVMTDAPLFFFFSNWESLSSHSQGMVTTSQPPLLQQQNILVG